MYDAARSTTAAGTLQIVGTVDTTQYEETVPLGSTFYDRVRARSACGLSALSPADAGSPGTPPPAPTNVAPTDSTLCDRVRVSCTPIPGTVYEVQRHTLPSGHFALTASPNITYQYFVKAVNSCGAGVSSSSVSGRRECN